MQNKEETTQKGQDPVLS